MIIWVMITWSGPSKLWFVRQYCLGERPTGNNNNSKGVMQTWQNVWGQCISDWGLGKVGGGGNIIKVILVLLFYYLNWLQPKNLCLPTRYNARPSSLWNPLDCFLATFWIVDWIYIGAVCLGVLSYPELFPRSQRLWCLLQFHQLAAKQDRHEQYTTYI